MDIFIPIVILVMIFISFSLCGWCCKRKREGTVYGFGPHVTVTSQHITASSVVQPPYPVEPRHPTPHAGAPSAGFTHQPPYPTHTPQGMPVPGYYPPPSGVAPYPPTTTPYPPTSAPYPPTTPYPPGGDRGGLPPSYSEAVGQPPAQPAPTTEFYGKQAPYNPNY